MKCTEHVARKEGREMYTGFWLENLKQRNYLGNLGIDWSMILKWILNRKGKRELD